MFQTLLIECRKILTNKILFSQYFFWKASEMIVPFSHDYVCLAEISEKQKITFCAHYIEIGIGD